MELCFSCSPCTDYKAMMRAPLALLPDGGRVGALSLFVWPEALQNSGTKAAI